MPNIKVINKLVRLWGGSVMPDCQPLFKALKWLTLPGILRFDHLFRVAQFGRIGGSLCSGLVAQYGPDYSHENPTLLACPTYARMRTDLQSLLPFSGAVHSLLTVVEHEYPPLLAFA